jgi:hypothetical protein
MITAARCDGVMPPAFRALRAAEREAGVSRFVVVFIRNSL